MSEFQNHIGAILQSDYGVTIEQAGPGELYGAVSKAAMCEVRKRWPQDDSRKRACYFSAEFLIGRMVYSNLFNMGLLDEAQELLRSHGKDLSALEDIGDAALGNGGLGRLAACFLDSAATHDIPLDGFGIRYRYGLFRQFFWDGFQHEEPDDWQKNGDPWSVRREDERELVRFAGQEVWAVPYDMPVIGYGGAAMNTLRLWQAEPVNAFDFGAFNRQDYPEASRQRDEAEAITALLYPNDDTQEGKRLRLKQQYFFCCASLKCLVRRYEKQHGSNFSGFPEAYAIQLNDTHPTIAAPELLRILMAERHVAFDDALDIVRRTFAYTNHTIMAEALEKWSVDLFCSVAPAVYPYIVMLDDALGRELAARGTVGSEQARRRIIDDGTIHMARMAIFASHSTNGVARIHTEILKNEALPEWYGLYPERFINQTNGITQRRWLALCNPELAQFATERVGDGWLTDLTVLKGLERYADDGASLERFMDIKREKKQQLAAFVKKREHAELDPSFLFDIQVKRIHEYKRQLLNAFSIMDIYFGLKDGRITDFTPTAFLFGGKAAPGYRRAKGIIKYINELARLVDSDPMVRDKLRVLFVQDYNVSYAEKLIPAADVSEQISTAGTEASGTGNMKFMLNGAVTLGTLDGANVEIVEQAGEHNEYIFGARVEDIAALRGHYDPRGLYEHEPRIHAVVDTLVNGTLSDGNTGMFRELYDALLYGASWHAPDNYFILHDLLPYCDAKLRVNRDYRDRQAFARRALANTANAGVFSSDRTVQGYARDIWKL